MGVLWPTTRSAGEQARVLGCGTKSVPSARAAAFVVVAAPLAITAGLPAAPMYEARVGIAGPVVVTTRPVSMDQAVKKVEQQYRARVVRAETHRQDAHTVYVLRLLNDAGHVWTVRVDAESGAIM
jgi:hypothetical protein